MLQLFQLLFISVIFSSCHSQSEIPTVPPRKSSIPADAFWIDGGDGGNWYQVGYIHGHRNSASIKVFDDESGRLLIDKEFDVLCVLKKGSGILIEDLKNQIVRLEGDKIYIKQEKGRDSCWLQAL